MIVAFLLKHFKTN